MNNTKVIDSKGSSIIEGLLNESAIADLFEDLYIEDIEEIKIIET